MQEEALTSKDLPDECYEILDILEGDDYINQVRKLASLSCTIAEIAAFFGCHERLIYLRMDTDEAFRDAIEQGRNLGKLSLRRQQFNIAQDGNATMLIWLGKQILGQRDNTRIKLDLDDCLNNKEKAEKILHAAAKGEISVQDGNMLMNMAKTVIDEQTLESIERIRKLEMIANGE